MRHSGGVTGAGREGVGGRPRRCRVLRTGGGLGAGKPRRPALKLLDDLQSLHSSHRDQPPGGRGRGLALETRTETRFFLSRCFLNVDYRCNSGFVTRMPYIIVSYKTVMRLIWVVRNPANDFPARLLGVPGRHGAFEPPALPNDRRVRSVSPGNPTRSRWLETALFTAMAVNPHSP